MGPDTQKIIAQAKEELRQEAFAEAVAEMKIKLREKKSLLDRIFPYKIILIKK